MAIIKTKFEVGDKVYVVGLARYDKGYSLGTIPLGKPVYITATLGGLIDKNAQPYVRYEIRFDAIEGCWVDEDVLSAAPPVSS